MHSTNIHQINSCINFIVPFTFKPEAITVKKHKKKYKIIFYYINFNRQAELYIDRRLKNASVYLFLLTKILRYLWARIEFIRHKLSYFIDSMEQRYGYECFEKHYARLKRPPKLDTQRCIDRARKRSKSSSIHNMRVFFFSYVCTSCCKTVVFIDR